MLHDSHKYLMLHDSHKYLMLHDSHKYLMLHDSHKYLMLHDSHKYLMLHDSHKYLMLHDSHKYLMLHDLRLPTTPTRSLSSVFSQTEPPRRVDCSAPLWDCWHNVSFPKALRCTAQFRN